MVGAFGSLFALHAIGIQTADAPPSGLGLAGVLVFMVLAGGVVASIGAVLLERLAYRPLRKRGAPRLAFLISAIGASLFVQELLALRYGRDPLPFPRIVNRTEVFSVFGASVQVPQVIVVIASVVMMIGLDRFVSGTRLGRGLRATAQDPQTAQLMGVDINRIIVVTFVVGGLLAGFAGTLFFGLLVESVKYNSGFIYGIKAFTAAVLGGIGNIRGAFLGGFALGVLESYGATVLGGEWKDVFAFTILVLVLMFRPTGLLGESLGRARA